jgi:hypothetical protein
MGGRCKNRSTAPRQDRALAQGNAPSKHRPPPSRRCPHTPTQATHAATHASTSRWSHREMASRGMRTTVHVLALRDLAAADALRLHVPTEVDLVRLRGAVGTQRHPVNLRRLVIAPTTHTTRAVSATLHPNCRGRAMHWVAVPKALRARRFNRRRSSAQAAAGRARHALPCGSPRAERPSAPSNTPPAPRCPHPAPPPPVAARSPHLPGRFRPQYFLTRTGVI